MISVQFQNTIYYQLFIISADIFKWSNLTKLSLTNLSKFAIRVLEVGRFEKIPWDFSAPFAQCA